MRGTRTHGYGRVGQHRKTGQRAGRGKTTQWKKSMYSYYLKQKELGFPDPDWDLRKKGFKRPQDIKRIYHVNTINVKDLEGAMRFFSDILGTKFVGPIDHQPKGYAVRVAFDNAGIELVSPTVADHPVAKYGEGLYGIAIRVPDIDNAIAELEAKGLKLERRGELPGLKVAMFYPENAYGCRIELVQYDVARPVCVANVGKTAELPWSS